MRRVGVYFDHKAVGPGGNGRQRHGGHVLPVPRGVTWVDNDGQMAKAANHGNNTEVQRVARGRLEGSDASLAENDVGVALREQVLGGHEIFVDLRGHTTFEQNGFSRLSGDLKESEVLDIARADLDHVGVLAQEIDIAGSDEFGDDAQVRFVGREAHEFQAIFLHALETVG